MVQPLKCRVTEQSISYAGRYDRNAASHSLSPFGNIWSIHARGLRQPHRGDRVRSVLSFASHSALAIHFGPPCEGQRWLVCPVPIVLPLRLSEERGRERYQTHANEKAQAWMTPS